jgi:protein-arginine kinase
LGKPCTESPGLLAGPEDTFVISHRTEVVPQVIEADQQIRKKVFRSLAGELPIEVHGSTGVFQCVLMLTQIAQDIGKVVEAHSEVREKGLGIWRPPGQNAQGFETALERYP